MEGPKLAQAEGGRALVNIVRPELELGQQEVANLYRRVSIDFEPHRAAEAATTQLRLDCGQEVVGLAFLEVEVGVARDPEGVVAPYLHVREKPGQVRGDQLLEGHEARTTVQRHETRQQWRYLHPREPLLASAGILDKHRQVERQVRDVGERMAGVHRQRRKDREDLLLEDAEDPCFLRRIEVVDAGEVKARAGETRHDRRLEYLVAARHEASALDADVLELL